MGTYTKAKANANAKARVKYPPMPPPSVNPPEKVKRPRTLKAAEHKQPLKTLSDIRSEAARLYRLGLNSRISPDEMVQFIVALREVRASIAAVNDERERNAERFGTFDHHSGNMTGTVPEIRINAIPHNSFISPRGEVVDSETATREWELHHHMYQRPAAALGPPALKVFDGEATELVDQPPDDPTLDA